MDKKYFNRVFILLSLFFLFCGTVPVFSQAPKLGQPTLLQQALNTLPAVPIPSVGSLKFEFGGDVWMAKLSGKNVSAGTITLHNTNEGNILVLKQTHIYVKIAWVPTPGADIILEYKRGPPVSFKLISKSELDEKLAATDGAGSLTPPPAGQASIAESAPLPPVGSYDDENDFTTEIINDGSAARITGYTGKSTDVRIPPHIENRPVTEIGERAFIKKGLTSIAIPDSVIFIGGMAFAENQISSVRIGANVYIANNAFDSSWYNSSFAGLYNSQGRKAGIYNNSWSLVSPTASEATQAGGMQGSNTSTATASQQEPAKSSQPAQPVQPKPLPKEKKPVNPEDAKLWSVGASLGTSYPARAPLFIGTVRGTLAPFNYSFLELGMDIGGNKFDVHTYYADYNGLEEVKYFSLYPFANYALFLPFTRTARGKRGGWYAGAGLGVMFAKYTFEIEGPIWDTAFVVNLVTGFNILDMFDISYTLRTDFKSRYFGDWFNGKFTIGYVYRF